MLIMSDIYLNICPKLNAWNANQSSYKPQKIKNFKYNLNKNWKLQMALKNFSQRSHNEVFGM